MFYFKTQGWGAIAIQSRVFLAPWSRSRSRGRLRKNQELVISLVLYTSCSFTLVVCGEKNISLNLTNSQELEPELESQGAACFWFLGAGAGAA